MTCPSRCHGPMVLVLAACSSFTPSSSGIEFDVSTITYARPSPADITLTYEAKRGHELQALCAHLVQAKAFERLTLRGPGYVPATPEHCFVTTPATLASGEKRKFSHTFPGEAGLFTDPRAKMRVVLRILVLREGQRVPRESNWPLD